MVLPQIHMGKKPYPVEVDISMGKKIEFSAKRYFLFDMDGTLVDSVWLWDGFLQKYLQKYHKETDIKAQEMFDNQTLRNSAEYVAVQYGLPLSGDAVFSQWKEEIRGIYQKRIRLKRGAGRYLYDLKNSGKKIALVTANHRELAEGCMKSNGIMELFDALICGDEMETDKSDPEYYKAALSRLGGRADKAVLFEDTYKTLMTARKVPIDTVIVEDLSSRREKQILMENADLYIRDFCDEALYC